MHFTKNIQFTKLIKAGNQLREFNFRKNTSLAGDIFTIDVADLTGQRYYLLYMKNKDGWTLQTKHPAKWILDAIPLIKDTLDKEYK